ncbi:MAG: FAD-dependent oxidoreductase [Lentisphaerae bacterium]|jgi:hypothetical protein|nr:FAD-dependent oxidoreductase [Lentisphaerota bacterium]MBT4818572.1 FAD-dependent oxidoreductase [Lentisphaerota bacterium]MBT5609355.1 FAD-dependent oxidoreductase [Lentisphaerota bacterium]MBT7057237.1 FAD-dependent oxidoreductase [Lentisphaerota bacterium]MBT7843518.1 FAD-dependent oxidoreductase [Lentisphaerota bacterium]
MDSRIREPARELDVIDSADIVVLGGGPAGVAAAVAAGRLGADVLLVERYGCLGGLATGGLVIVLVSYGKRGEILMSGLAVEFLDRLKTRGTVRTPEWVKMENPVCDPEVLKFICLEMIEDAGVDLLLHAWAVDASVVDGRIDAVIIESKSGRQAIRGKLFIDCTGDGDTAAWANVPYEESDAAFGLGLDWRWGNVDYMAFRDFSLDQPEALAALRKAMSAEGVAYPPKPAWRDDRTWFITATPGNALDVRDLTRCEVEMRKCAMRTYDFYRANVPGFDQATIIDTASQVGTRESRRIVGGYTMRDEDVPGGRFDDTIGTGVTWTGKRAGEPFDFPYRALVPQKIENLLYAGRCISACHEAHQNTRVIPNCWVTGQGAGVAAALAVQNSVSPGDVPIEAIQRALTDSGVVL